MDCPFLITSLGFVNSNVYLPTIDHVGKTKVPEWVFEMMSFVATSLQCSFDEIVAVVVVILR
jgi:hypothetical protein